MPITCQSNKQGQDDDDEPSFNEILIMITSQQASEQREWQADREEQWEDGHMQMSMFHAQMQQQQAQMQQQNQQQTNLIAAMMMMINGSGRSNGAPSRGSHRETEM